MQKPTLFSIIFMAVLALTSCSTTKTSPTSPTAIKDQKLSTYFTDEGIKITYSLFGKLEKIEVYGQADAWKGNLEALAEADAYASSAKRIHWFGSAKCYKADLGDKAAALTLAQCELRMVGLRQAVHDSQAQARTCGAVTRGVQSGERLHQSCDLIFRYARSAI